MSSSVDVNVNSYDAGHRPYVNDKTRGKWEGQWDFHLSCIGHAFGLKNFTLLVSAMQYGGGIMLLFPLLICFLFYVVPIFFIQSYMGQFSSTGYISVFRISPLFKGIGYVILALNFTSVLYYSSVATFPLLFFFKSFAFNTSWMSCGNSWNTANCIEMSNDTNSSSLEPLFEYYVHDVLKLKNSSDSFDFSWPLILGELLLWIIVAACIFNGIEVIGRILRYSTLVGLTLMAILLIRILFLPEAGIDIQEFFDLQFYSRALQPSFWLFTPVIASMTLGNGWGITLTMASYNCFKKNANRYSFTVPLSILGVTFISGLITHVIDAYLSKRVQFSMYYFDEHAFEFTFVALPYFFGTLEASQMWSMIFYLMIFLYEINSIIIQAFSIITAICDEYAGIRYYKKQLTIGVCGLCFILSTLFSTNYMADSYKPFVACAYFTQMLICFIEVLLLVWVYGRDRFLGDVRFMLVKTFRSWKFYVIRFITPIFISLVLLYNLFYTAYYLLHESMWLVIVAGIVKGLPWIFIPGYIIFKLMATTGTFKERFLKCTRPNDWYPADPVDRHKYQIALGSADISQQLLEMDHHEVP